MRTLFVVLLHVLSLTAYLTSQLPTLYYSFQALTRMKIGIAQLKNLSTFSTHYVQFKQSVLPVSRQMLHRKIAVAVVGALVISYLPNFDAHLTEKSLTLWTFHWLIDQVFANAAFEGYIQLFAVSQVLQVKAFSLH